MRLSASVICICVLALFAGTSARAYPWPVKPFNQQHPIRGNFGDPRTIFDDSILTGGATGPGRFLFHNGIDIVAPDGTPVYPVVSGIARVVNHEEVSVRTPIGRKFQYWHIIPAVANGQHVIASRTVLGHIRPGADHVHLTEVRRYKVWNPLAPGGIAPYHDTTPPVLRTLYIRRGETFDVVDPSAVCGRISIVADAYDTQSPPAWGPFAGFPLSPARVTWSMSRSGTTRRLMSVSGSVDFSETLPAEADFWEVYARGTYQNSPRFGRRQYAMPGLFLFRLTRQVLDTRELANGEYRITIRLADMRDNVSTYVRDIVVANDGDSPTGCPEEPPAPPPQPPPLEPAP